MQMMMQAFLIVLSQIYLTSYAITLTTAKNPIILNLRRFNRDNTTSRVNTKPLFFQSALDLRSGEPFQLNIENWIALQRSGLFSNLTAKSIVIVDEESKSESVALEISGDEVPAISFSPEVGFSLSLTRPEICGGVRTMLLFPK